MSRQITLEQQIVRENLGYPGAMISESKSGYRDRHPDNVVVFNANLASKSYGKIWYGDIDITISKDKLFLAREAVGEDLYVLYEDDLRFDNEDKKLNEVLKYASAFYKVEENAIIKYDIARINKEAFHVKKIILNKE